MDFNLTQVIDYPVEDHFILDKSKPSYKLKIIESGNNEILQNQIFLLKHGENIIGRDANCQVFIDDKTLSRSHAVIYAHEDMLEIYDLGSTNKTYRGKLCLRPNVHYELKIGERISFGIIVAEVHECKINEHEISDSETGSESMLPENNEENMCRPKVLASDSDETDAEDSIEPKDEVVIPETPHANKASIFNKADATDLQDDQEFEEERPASSLLIDYNEEPFLNDTDCSESSIQDDIVSENRSDSIKPDNDSVANAKDCDRKLNFSQKNDLICVDNVNIQSFEETSPIVQHDSLKSTNDMNLNLSNSPESPGKVIDLDANDLIVEESTDDDASCPSSLPNHYKKCTNNKFSTFHNLSPSQPYIEDQSDVDMVAGKKLISKDVDFDHDKLDKDAKSIGTTEMKFCSEENNHSNSEKIEHIKLFSLPDTQPYTHNSSVHLDNDEKTSSSSFNTSSDLNKFLPLAETQPYFERATEKESLSPLSKGNVQPTWSNNDSNDQTEDSQRTSTYNKDRKMLQEVDEYLLSPTQPYNPNDGVKFKLNESKEETKDNMLLPTQPYPDTEDSTDGNDPNDAIESNLKHKDEKHKENVLLPAQPYVHNDDDPLNEVNDNEKMMFQPTQPYMDIKELSDENDSNDAIKSHLKHKDEKHKTNILFPTQPYVDNEKVVLQPTQPYMDIKDTSDEKDSDAIESHPKSKYTKNKNTVLLPTQPYVDNDDSQLNEDNDNEKMMLQPTQPYVDIKNPSDENVSDAIESHPKSKYKNTVLLPTQPYVDNDEDNDNEEILLQPTQPYMDIKESSDESDHIDIIESYPKPEDENHKGSVLLPIQPYEDNDNEDMMLQPTQSYMYIKDPSDENEDNDIIQPKPEYVKQKNDILLPTQPYICSNDEDNDQMLSQSESNNEKSQNSILLPTQPYIDEHDLDDFKLTQPCLNKKFVKNIAHCIKLKDHIRDDCLNNEEVASTSFLKGVKEVCSEDSNSCDSISLMATQPYIQHPEDNVKVETSFQIMSKDERISEKTTSKRKLNEKEIEELLISSQVNNSSISTNQEVQAVCSNSAEPKLESKGNSFSLENTIKPKRRKPAMKKDMRESDDGSYLERITRKRRSGKKNKDNHLEEANNLEKQKDGVECNVLSFKNIIMERKIKSISGCSSSRELDGVGSVNGIDDSKHCHLPIDDIASNIKNQSPKWQKLVSKRPSSDYNVYSFRKSKRLQKSTIGDAENTTLLSDRDCINSIKSEKLEVTSVNSDNSTKKSKIQSSSKRQSQRRKIIETNICEDASSSMTDHYARKNIKNEEIKSVIDPEDSSLLMNDCEENGHKLVLRPTRRLQRKKLTNQSYDKMGAESSVSSATNNFECSVKKVFLKNRGKKVLGAAKASDEDISDHSHLTLMEKCTLNVSNSLNASITDKRRSLPPASKLKIMFTGDVKTDANIKIIESLGSKITDSPQECSVLITDKFRRTVKTMCCVAMGKPILMPSWLQKCKQEKGVADPSSFEIKAVEAENQYNFNLSTTLELAAHQPFLKGYKVFVTKNVKPPPNEMKEIIQAAGAKFLSKISRKNQDNQTIIISCQEDMDTIKEDLKNIVSNEFLLTGTLRYDNNPHSYPIVKLYVKKSSRTR